MKLKLSALTLVALLVSNAAFAMQGRGGGGGGGGGRGNGNAGVGTPSNSGSFNRGASVSTPSNPGSSQNRGASAAAEHKPESAGPKDNMGFKNFGQYTAAKEVSDNLGIPMGDLKASMVDGNMSLGEAIHKARPELTAKQVQAETKRAEAAAKKAEAEAKKQAGKPTT